MGEDLAGIPFTISRALSSKAPHRVRSRCGANRSSLPPSAVARPLPTRSRPASDERALPSFLPPCRVPLPGFFLPAPPGSRFSPPRTAALDSRRVRRAAPNGDDGIYAGSAGTGASLARAIVKDCVARHNGGSGVVADTGGVVIAAANVLSENGCYRMQQNAGGTIKSTGNKHHRGQHPGGVFGTSGISINRRRRASPP